MWVIILFERLGAQEGLLGDVTFILKDSKGATKLNKEQIMLEKKVAKYLYRN